ncbi:predicted protein [Uncinocarpus reesii 1704]|uniref:Transcription factor Rba50 n=1 Tax=Uncinocarpus reesii (strain UAMH 1704) TaxID=336963 RepID=C4JDS0_UNCRE|nr:uncharacterized protein UREG_00547 [Uncinocarpus reesii 1704]EEP75700.1 predicted protein [Uncinocarpus reesii 1704]
MAIRGQRFTVNLDDLDDSLDFVADIRERTTAAPPAPPQPPTTGFPPHRKRKPSAFKRQRAADQTISPTPQSKPPQDEQRSIDEENRQRLAAMSPAQIERERAELMSALPSSLIERLLKRANIDSDHPADRPEPQAKPVSFDLPDTQNTPQEPPSHPPDDMPPPNPPPDLLPASQPPSAPIHFPTPPNDSPMPNLDPSSPSFLADLQSHYFPNTPHDTASLSWLKPASPDEEPPTSAYHPASTATALAPASLRFSLTGQILAPRTSLALPTTLGLHHHAKDPEAAGYTVPELAILSRSTVPAQRCLAWQVLGRLLYRLGKGEFGEKGSRLVEGLWSVVEREKVVAGMLNEAGGSLDGLSTNRGGIGRHASATAWATEAVWLWRQGGGDRGLLRDGEVRSQ